MDINDLFHKLSSGARFKQKAVPTRAEVRKNVCFLTSLQYNFYTQKQRQHFSDKDHDQFVTSALDFFGDSTPLAQQPQQGIMSTSRGGPLLGKRERGEGGSDSECEVGDSEDEGEVSHEQSGCETEESGGVASQPCTRVGEGSTHRKRKKKKLSKETKELLRRQEVMA